MEGQKMMTSDSIRIKAEEQIKKTKRLFQLAMCKGGNESYQICANINCKADSNMCTDSKCECQKQHEMCVTILPQKLIKGLLKPSILSTQFLENLENQLDNLKEKISQIQENIPKMGSTIGRTQAQKDFIQLIQDKNFNKISGSVVGQVCADINRTNQRIVNREKIEAVIGQEVCVVISKMVAEIDNLTNIFGFTKIEKILYRAQRQLTIPLNSQVIQTEEQIDFLVKNISTRQRQVSHFQLLYRASQNDFRTEAFHRNCGKVANTLVVLRNEFKKIIGGYTPIPWLPSNHGSYATDPTHQTFIFSLTDLQKVPMKPVINTLLHNSTCGPIFACDNQSHDLAIYGQANRRRSSHSKVGGNYQIIGKYENNPTQNREHWKQFSGSITSEFCIEEWEVYHVVFKTYEQKK